MKHNQYREWLQLSLYDELALPDRQLLDNHLETCQDCRTELEQFQKLHGALEATRMPESLDSLLEEARQELRASLRLERSRRGGWSRLRSRISGVLLPAFTGWNPLRLAGAALAMVAIGLFSGYFIFHLTQSGNESLNPSDPLARGDIDVGNVRFLDPDARDGQIALSFDATRHVRIKGNINDPRIEKILARALVNSQNPGVRLNAISAMQTYQPRPADRDVKQALLLALQSDENPGVRKEALVTLQKYPMDEELRRAFLQVLIHDTNPGLRIEAIRSLEAAAEKRRFVDPEMLGVLRDKMNSDDNSYVRIRAKSVLEEVTQK